MSRMTLEDIHEAWQQHVDFTGGGDDDVTLGASQRHHEKEARAETMSLPAFLVAFEDLARAKYLFRQRHGTVNRLLLSDVFGNAIATVSGGDDSGCNEVLGVRCTTVKYIPSPI